MKIDIRTHLLICTLNRNDEVVSVNLNMKKINVLNNTLPVYMNISHFTLTQLMYLLNKFTDVYEPQLVMPLNDIEPQFQPQAEHMCEVLHL